MRVPDHWVLGSAYIITLAGSRKFFPQLHSRSNTHVDVMQLTEIGLPRLFRDETHAKNFLRQWRRGRMTSSEDGEIFVRKVIGREHIKFDIIPLKLVIEPTI